MLNKYSDNVDKVIDHAIVKLYLHCEYPVCGSSYDMIRGSVYDMYNRKLSSITITLFDIEFCHFEDMWNNCMEKIWTNNLDDILPAELKREYLYREVETLNLFKKALKQQLTKILK